MNDKHTRKMIAPITTRNFSFYFALNLDIGPITYLIAVMFASEFHPAFMLFAIPLIALATGMIYTLKSRINEIRSGEEDDLSDY